MDVGNQFIRICRDDREGTYSLTCAGLFPVLPKTCNAERRAILHGNGIGLLGLLAFDRLPLEEVDAAVTHVHAVDNGIAQRTTALDDSPAHGRDVGIHA